MNAPQPDKITPSAATVPPGALLRQARQQLGLELSDLAELTRLAPGLLVALERDDFASLGQPVFVRGYYRKCADVLGMNGDALVNAYEAATGTESPVPEINQRPSIRYREGPGLARVLLGASIVASVVTVAGWWLFESGFLEGKLLPVPRPSPQAAAAPRDAAAASAVTRAERPGLEVAKSADPAPAVVSADTLRFEFLGESWVEVVDQSGSKLLYTLVPAGEEREVSGQPPYRVYLGYAPGVRAWLNGRRLDFRERIGEDSTAQFRVGRPQ